MYSMALLVRDKKKSYKVINNYIWLTDNYTSQQQVFIFLFPYCFFSDH